MPAYLHRYLGLSFSKRPMRTQRSQIGYPRPGSLKPPRKIAIHLYSRPPSVLPTTLCLKPEHSLGQGFRAKVWRLGVDKVLSAKTRHTSYRLRTLAWQPGKKPRRGYLKTHRNARHLFRRRAGKSVQHSGETGRSAPTRLPKHKWLGRACVCIYALPPLSLYCRSLVGCLYICTRSHE